MSLEYTIDIQLTELGFPDILQTCAAVVRESPRLSASLSGGDGHTRLPTKPTPRRLLIKDPSVTHSQPTRDTRGSSPAPTKPGTMCSNDAFTFSVLLGTKKRRRGKHVIPETPGGLATGAKAGDDKVANKNTQDVDDESADDSEVSEDCDENSLDEDQDCFDDESGGTGDYRCGVCGLQLASNMKLLDHMNLHTGQRPHCCSECGKRFCQLGNYRAHLKTHAEGEPDRVHSLWCPLCTKPFASKGELRAHLTTKHAERDFYECDSCKLLFTERKECKKHIEWHESTHRRFACDTCGRRFSTQRSLKHHRNRKCLRSFACTDCDRTFGRKNALLRHSFSHVGLLPYTCMLCSCHFRLARLYRQHKCKPQSVHCVACLRAFSSAEDFQQHKKDTGCWGHQEPKGSEIRCPECGESFATREELKKHGGAHQRVLTCAECGKGFRSALLLMSHMGGHAAQTPCLCQSCGRGFLHQLDYDRHLERCGLAPLSPAVSKKRAQKSGAAPDQPTPPPVTGLPVASAASASGSDPASAAAPTRARAPTRGRGRSRAPARAPARPRGLAPSPETPGGHWRLTLDKPPPAGVQLILFFPVKPGGGMGPVQPPTQAILDASVELHRRTVGERTSSAGGSPPEVADDNMPLDLSMKSSRLVPAVSVNTPALGIKWPAHHLETATVSLKPTTISLITPTVSLIRPTVSLKTPTIGVKTPPDSIKMPTVSLKMDPDSVKMPTVSLKTATVSVKSESLAPAVTAPAGSVTAAIRECWVVLRRWSGETLGPTGDACSCLHRKTETLESVCSKAHCNMLSTVKTEALGAAPLLVEVKEEPMSPTRVSEELQL